MFIVINIGCIECGVSSGVVGVFTSEKRANVVAETLREKMNWREGGQNSYEVFPMPSVDVVADEYREALPDTASSE